MDAAERISRSQRSGSKVAKVLQKRMQTTNEKFVRRLKEAKSDPATDPFSAAAALANPASWYGYAVDATQRSVLFWDTLWERGNNFIDNTAQGLKPVLHFEYETVLDGRTFDRPVNYTLLRITPPAGVVVDPCAASLPHHRSARRPRPRHRRLQGRLAGRRRAARRTSGVFRHLLSRPRARPDAARRLPRRAAFREEGARNCIPTAPSPPSSATARADGPR